MTTLDYHREWNITGGPLGADRLDEAVRLLHERVRHASARHPNMPRYWAGGEDRLRPIVSNWIESDRAVCLVDPRTDELVAWAGYDAFRFHGEPSAFTPVLGHACSVGPDASAGDAAGAEAGVAASAGNAAATRPVYTMLNAVLGERWVSRDLLSHHFSLFAHEESARVQLYTNGYGLFVVDAYRISAQAGVDDPDLRRSEQVTEDRPRQAGGLVVRQAGADDVRALRSLCDETTGYYASSPIFLVRDHENSSVDESLVTQPDRAVFMAFDDSRPVGFMSIRRSGEREPVTLAVPECAMIDDPGAYVLSDARRAGAGRALLEACMAWCRDRGIESVHVDFESANPCAHAFWPRHFQPTILSMKRRVAEDVRGVADRATNA